MAELLILLIHIHMYVPLLLSIQLESVGNILDVSSVCIYLSPCGEHLKDVLKYSMSCLLASRASGKC